MNPYDHAWFLSAEAPKAIAQDLDRGDATAAEALMEETILERTKEILRQQPGNAALSDNKLLSLPGGGAIAIDQMPKLNEEIYKFKSATRGIGCDIEISFPGSSSARFTGTDCHLPEHK